MYVYIYIYIFIYIFITFSNVVQLTLTLKDIYHRWTVTDRRGDELHSRRMSRQTQGVFLLTMRISIVPVNRDFSMNTYS